LATLFARFVAGRCHKRLEIVAAAWIAVDKRESRFVPFCPRRRTSGPPRRDPANSATAAQPAVVHRRLTAVSSFQGAARFATAGPQVPRRHGPRVSVQVFIPDAEPWRKGQLLATAAPRAACETEIDGCRQRPRLQSAPRMSPASPQLRSLRRRVLRAVVVILSFFCPSCLLPLTPLPSCYSFLRSLRALAQLDTWAPCTARDAVRHSQFSKGNLIDTS
jgi:hypothetical protein